MSITVDPDSTGKIVNTSTVAGEERVNEVISDPTDAAGVARVKNAAPGAADYGLVVRIAQDASLTDAQLRASAVPVSGTFFQATQPVSIAAAVAVTGTFWQATQPVSLAAAVDISDKDARLLGRVKNLDSAGAVIDPALKGQLPAALVGGRLSVDVGASVAVAVTGTFFQATQPVSATQLPAALGQGTMAQSMKVVLASDQSTLPAVAEMRGATLHVTGTAAVNTGVTVTLPAPAAGLFHYITSIQIVKLYSVIGVAAGAGVILTSTNLPGNPAWTTEQLASPAGTATKVLDYQPTTPLKSSVAATATTIVCPVQLQTIWRVNVSYFTAA